jgi:uncharacterized protein YqeY
MTRELGSIESRVKDDATAALRAGDKRLRTALNMLLAALKKERIDSGSAVPSEADELLVVKRERKRQSEAIEIYEQGGRADLADQARYEEALLASYLPAELSEPELITLVNEAIAQTGATTTKEMGKVMSALLPRVAGRADNKRLSELVRGRLAG